MKYRQTNSNILLITLIALFTGLSACNESSVSDDGEEQLTSVLVANEGNFSDGNGSLTSFNPETGQAVQQRFSQVNGRPLAAIIQAVVESDNRVFIVTNSADKIEVADRESLESLGTINFDNGVAPAGFALADGNKGYVSDLFTNTIHVVDLESYEVTGTQIEVGDNPQGMAISGNRLFVANSGFGSGNTVSVIDTDTDQATGKIDVGAGPIQLIIDNDGGLWVLSSGYTAYDEDFNRTPENDIPGQIDILDAATAEWVTTIDTGGFPSSLAVSTELGIAWVVNDGAIQQIDINSLELFEENLIDRDFNGIGYSSAENLLYLAQSRGFTQSGQAIIYDLQGAAVDSFQTGIAPFDFIFRVEEN